MSDIVRRHYELYPYPHYPLLASVRRCDTYAANLSALWCRFNGELPSPEARRILIAGCGSFSPYPFALANPDTPITALDLSASSLRRARLHCLLHGQRHVTFREGDLRDPCAIDGAFGLIDSFGVLHHLEDPLAGMRALAAHLCEGGILRVMVYSRYTRREEESVRRALRILGVRDPATARRLLKRARKGSRLRRFLEASEEVSGTAGLADALLHPCVTTYRIDEFMELVAASGLQPLLFAHRHALPDVEEEIARIRALEGQKRSPGNFVLYLGRGTKGGCGTEEDSLFLLNPALSGAVRSLRPGALHIPPRLGHHNPPLRGGDRRFLRRFLRPVGSDALTREEREAALSFAEKLFLLQYRRSPL
ncbi:class I SAM-dependent methyltransferase [Geomonas sp. RF6]|uniref:class I SAM-dependent methyltransferase n=1 Tax=Geomonas sp. RF6 TaxID=2897342 RepID=UPI001E4034A8|nr:class I SAM-dependent methyltransferase [Geomonas sp. RF6]UFS68778.1 class I SAM-dependent methyltransferase [Geomonas sp. RF6]